MRISMQLRLRERIILDDQFDNFHIDQEGHIEGLHYVAGLDITVDKKKTRYGFATLAILSYPELKVKLFLSPYDLPKRMLYR